MTGAPTITEYANDAGEFDAEQDVETRSWYLPTKTVNALRDYVVGRTGTTQHIGAVCTRAMTNWMAEEPDDPAHRTWTRLQSDYDYSEADEAVTTWSYRHNTDYTQLDKDDKTALGFSAPATVIEAFADGLSKDEYGSELANAVEAELRKHAQIQRMHAIIDAGDAQRTDATERSPNPDEVSGLGDITMDDVEVILTPDIIQYVDAHDGDVDWQTRRGLLAALARHHGMMTKDGLYNNDENLFGVEKNDRKRKDKNALLGHAENTNDPLKVAPAQRVMDEMDEHNLVQAGGLSHRNCRIHYTDDEEETLTTVIYNSQDQDGSEMWWTYVEDVASIADRLIGYEYSDSNAVATAYNGKHYKDSINRFLPLMEATLAVMEAEGLDGMIQAISVRIERLEDARDDITGPAGKDVEDAYETFRERNEKPQSREFKRGKKSGSPLQF